MKEQEMKRLIEENIPETPEAFHDRMNQTLNSIVVQERCQRMLETKNVPVRRASGSAPVSRCRKAGWRSLTAAIAAA